MKLQLLIKKIFSELTPPEYLLYLLLFHEKHFCSGLCLFVTEMYNHKIINREELSVIIKWIQYNRPEEAGCFWFEPGELKPRIDYLKTFTPGNLKSRVEYLKTSL